MYKENKINIRLVGFELLLLFLEDVQTLEPSQVELFASAIDLGVFCSGPNTNARFRIAPLSGDKLLVVQVSIWRKLIYFTAPDKTCVLVPSTSAGLQENSVKLWEKMLESTMKKPTMFEFWLDLLKTQYFSVFYPTMSKQYGVVEDGRWRFRTIGDSF